MTIREALVAGTRFLDDHSISNPRLTAEVLLSHTLSADRTTLFTHDDRPLSAEDWSSFKTALEQRAVGVPLQYITGKQEFYGRVFSVTPDVLIPRPETELIIETVLELNRTPSPKIVDVGTGSGCLGVTLASEIPGARVLATDISLAALQLARQNASKLGAVVEFVGMDLLDAVQTTFDFVVCNPPYVASDDYTGVQREVRDHEPDIALFAPGDPLSVYRRLVPSALDKLKQGGYLVMEIAMGMEDQVRKLLDSRWEALPTRLDLQGFPRTMVAQKAG